MFDLNGYKRSINAQQRDYTVKQTIYDVKDMLNTILFKDCFCARV